eukprot:1189164-Prorocentrum_minimum.AAC.6
MVLDTEGSSHRRIFSGSHQGNCHYDRLLAGLRERLERLQQAPDPVVSYKDFSAPTEHDNELLRSLFAIKRDATSLASREEERIFFGLYVQAVSSIRETLLPA